MGKTFTIFKDGEILRVVTIPSDDIAAQMQPDEECIAGAYPATEYKIEQGVPVPRPSEEKSADELRLRMQRTRERRMLTALYKDLKAAGIALPRVDAEMGR